MASASCRAHTPAHGSNYHITISGAGINKYPAKQNAQAAARRLNVSEGLIYLLGQRTQEIEDSDNTYPFRQRRYFYYLSGVNEPNCYLTYDIKTNHLALFIPPYTSKDALWTGPKLTIPEAECGYDVDFVSLTSYLGSYIHDWLLDNPRSKIYALHEAQIPNALNLGCYIDTSSLLPALNACRTLKSPHELSLIRHAINLSSFAHRSILHHLTSLNSEAEIHAHFTDICIAHGAKRQAYAPIVASGKNAAVLHYTKNDELLKGKGSVCMDAGCEWDCYASDITRTFPTSTHGWASKETAEIYALVEEMQERCIKQLRPGVAFMDLYVLAHHIAIEGLLQLGIFKEGTDIDMIIESGFSRAFFPHGLGHHLGLEVHDVSAKPITGLQTEKDQNSVEHVKDDEHIHFNSKNCRALCQAIEGTGSRKQTCLYTSLLEENMVLTVEPGIYFSLPTLSDLYLPNPAFSAIINKSILDKYMHVGGVRIEDDILITVDGFENLTTAPKGEKMLEVIREGAKCQHGLDCEFRTLSYLRRNHAA